MVQHTSLAEAIEAWEKRHQYSSYEAANASGIPRATLYRFKTISGIIPEGKNLIRLADALGISVTEVLDLASNATKKDPQTSDEGE